MINQISKKIAVQIVKNDSAYEKDVGKIRLGLEIFFMMVLGVSLMVIISALLGNVWMWIPFLLGFAPLRNYGGGFHAKTPMRSTTNQP